MKGKTNAITLARTKIQIEIIRNCITKSKSIIVGNAFKNSLRNSSFFLARFPFILPSAGYLKELNQEIDIRIYDLKRIISISIKNLIADRNIYINDLFWFSTHDLKLGYILLYPNEYTERADWVLFLVDVKDADGTLYLPGDIKPFKHVNHLLSEMKGLSEKELGIAFTYVSKIELLNELSNLKSKI